VPQRDYKGRGIVEVPRDMEFLLEDGLIPSLGNIEEDFIFSCGLANRMKILKLDTNYLTLYIEVGGPTAIMTY
jgi:hypothetical protein